MRKDIRKLIWMVAIVVAISGVVFFYTPPVMPAMLLAAIGLLACGAAWMMWALRLENAVPVEPLVLPDAPETLRKWLEQATRGLGALSRQRIVEEVTVHYDEALQHAQHNAATEAESAAVASLGNPETARRGFRRVYFSAHEERWIRNRKGHLRADWVRLSPALFMILGSILLLALGFMVFVEGKTVGYYFGYVGMVFIGTGICELVMRLWVRAGKLRLAKTAEIALVVGIVTGLLPLMTTDLSDNGFSGDDLLVSLIVFLPAALWYTVREVRLARKLPAKASDDFRRDFRF